jgi:adenosine deaminase
MMTGSKNILVTTFGGTWAVLPELIGYTNPDVFDFYRNHSNRQNIFNKTYETNVVAADEIWVIHTDSEISAKAIEKFRTWQELTGITNPAVRYFSCEGISDMGTEQECKFMTDLILRVVLQATEMVVKGRLMISLTGGRKSMSADIQRASDIFGCSSVIHIADSINRSPILSKPEPLHLLSPLISSDVDQVNPMVVFGKKNPHAIVHIETTLKSAHYTVSEGTNEPHINLLQKVDERMQEVNSLIFNNYQQRVGHSPQTSFYGLQLISPRIIQHFENYNIGVSPEKAAEELEWLEQLPKAELHCHIGGILNPSEMIEVAHTLYKETDILLRENYLFSQWNNTLKSAVHNRDIQWLKPWLADSKKLLRQMQGIPEPFAVCAFISAFAGDSLLLEQLIYGDYIHTEKFCGIDIGPYEKLGDLQGSGLLKHPKTLSKTCEVLVEQCMVHNIRYCELRCSPANYETNNFKVNHIIEIIHKVLSEATHTIFKLIIIGSRHNNPDLFNKHTNLARELFSSSKYHQFFAGFDIAGDEEAKSPAKLKTELADLLHECVKMTIHAGETVKAENIWEAAYELNADRIGHGLTLIENKNLMNRFIERKIALEMCPSSNFQIKNYWHCILRNQTELPVYPLKAYFDKGIRVTINTDNPGISKTNLSNEYRMAAMMTPGGLSKWDIMKIIRNGFKSSFLQVDQKKNLLLKVEKELSEICNQIE